MDGYQGSGQESSGQEDAGHAGSGNEIRRDRKFWIALGLYAVLAVAIWFTLGEGTVLVLGRRVEIRWIPMFVIGTFVFRTYMAREADKIRRRN
jgi:hypothetical protein